MANGRHGGAVLVKIPGASAASISPSIAFSHCNFSSNTAGGSGGGLYVEINGTAEIIVTDTVCGGNIANVVGGCMAFLYTGQGSDESTVYLANNTYVANAADFGGGGVYILFAEPTSASTIIVSQFHCRDNTASLGGGGGAIGIVFAGAASSVTTTFVGGNYSGNNGTGTSQGGVSSFGGQFSPAGGVVLVQFNATATRCNTTIIGGTFSDNVAGGNLSLGGAVCIYYAAESVVACMNEVRNGTYVNNTAYLGGAVCMFFCVDVTMTTAELSDGYFASNSATIAGGAVAVSFLRAATDANVTIANGQYLSNTASTNGGGAIQIYHNDTTRHCWTTVVGGTYDQNIAQTASGGAILVYYNMSTVNSTTLISDGNYTKNEGIVGGAIYIVYDWQSQIQHNAVKITKSMFSSNTAVEASGGAVCIQSYASGTDDSVEVLDNIFTSNHAQNGAGGAFAYEAQGGYEDGLYLNIRSNYTNNTSYDIGGAVFVTFNTINISTGCRTFIQHGTYAANVANIQGGAVAIIHVSVTDFVTNISNCIFANNNGMYGGDVFCAYLGRATHVTNIFLLSTFDTDDDSAYTSSSAASNGRSLMVHYIQRTENMSLQIERCNFTGQNTADESGSVVAINIQNATEIAIDIRNITIATIPGYDRGSGLHVVLGSVPAVTATSQDPTASEMNSQLTHTVGCENNTAMSNPAINDARVILYGCTFMHLSDTAARIMLLSTATTSVQDVSVEVLHCVFMSNTASSTAGGGLLLAFSNILNCRVYVAHCWFLANSAGKPGAGGGIAVVAATFDNTTTGGSGFTACNSSVVIDNVSAVDNAAEFGGFLSVNTAMLYGLTVSVSGVTALSNTADSSGGVVFAECIDSDAHVQLIISNSTFHKNSAKSGTSIDMQSCHTLNVTGNFFNQSKRSTSTGAIITVRKGTVSFDSNNFSCVPNIGDIDRILIDADLVSEASVYNSSLEFPAVHCRGGLPLFWSQIQPENSIYFTAAPYQIELNITSGDAFSDQTGENRSQTASEFQAHLYTEQSLRYRVTCTACGTTTYQMSPVCGNCLQTYSHSDCCLPCPEHADCSMSVGLEPEKG